MSMAFCTQVDVKIGVTGPFTGSSTTYGAQYWKGVSQTMVGTNATGGTKDEKIVLVQGDDACGPKQAVAVANRLVDGAKVSTAVGHLCSSLTMPASEVYGETGTLTITPDSANPQITERDMKSPFHMCGRDDRRGAIVANYMLDMLKAKKIAVIRDRNAYGQGLADTTCVALVKRGTKEVLYESLSRGGKDFNALVAEIGALKPGVVYLDSCYPGAGLLACQMHKQGMQAKPFFDDCIVTKELVTAAGGSQFTDSVLMTSGQDPRTLPEGKAVIEGFRTSGFEPEGYTLYAYASVQAITATWNVVNADNAKASDRLKSHDVGMVMGKKARDDKDNLRVSDYVVYQWDDKGKYRQL